MNQATHYLYRIQPTRVEMLHQATAEEAAAVEAHFNYLKKLTGQGVVVLAGRTLNTDSSAFGIIIFKASSAAEAQAVVDNDPAVQQGVMSAELFPYRIALMAGS